VKKIECVLRPFRIHPLVQALSKARGLITNMWWLDAGGLAETNLVAQSGGSQFKTPATTVVYLNVLVPAAHLSTVLDLIREHLVDPIHENETLIVSDVASMLTAPTEAPT